MVRVTNMRNVDVANIQFDYDLVFAVLFMNGNGRVYSRYGGRTPWNAESRVSLEGLQYTMRQVLNVHRPELPPKAPPVEPLFARDLPALGSSCIHCHQVWEGLRRRDRSAGDFEESDFFVYPRPENIGLRLDVERGNVVVRVQRDSASELAGLLPGDEINWIGDDPIFSQADVSWALHRAPRTGKLNLEYTRDAERKSAKLTLDAYWRETNLSWRASMQRETPPERHKKK